MMSRAHAALDALDVEGLPKRRRGCLSSEELVNETRANPAILPASKRDDRSISMRVITLMRLTRRTESNWDEHGLQDCSSPLTVIDSTNSLNALWKGWNWDALKASGNDCDNSCVLPLSRVRFEDPWSTRNVPASRRFSSADHNMNSEPCMVNAMYSSNCIQSPAARFGSSYHLGGFSELSRY